MGRVKLEIKKIENTGSRLVTYAKRRNGLIKKAYELSVLCDIDIALIAFSPSGRLSLFSSKNCQIEDVITRFANLIEEEKEQSRNPKWQNNHEVVLNCELLTQAINKLKAESQLETAQFLSETSPNLQNIRMEIEKAQMQLQLAEDKLKIYELDIGFLNIQEAEELEQLMEQALTRIQIRMNLLQNNFAGSCDLENMKISFHENTDQCHIAGHQGSTTQLNAWSLLTETQLRALKIRDHANIQSSLSMRTLQATPESSLNASFYSATVPQGSCSHKQSNQSDSQLMQSDQCNVLPQSTLKDGQFYSFHPSLLQVKEEIMELNMGSCGCPHGKIEGVDVAQVTRRPDYETSGISCIAPPSGSQFCLVQVFNDGDMSNSLGQTLCGGNSDIQAFDKREMSNSLFHDCDSHAQIFHDNDVGNLHAQAFDNGDIRDSYAQIFHNYDIGNSHAKALHNGNMGNSNSITFFDDNMGNSNSITFFDDNMGNSNVQAFCDRNIQKFPDDNMEDSDIKVLLDQRFRDGDIVNSNAGTFHDSNDMKNSHVRTFHDSVMNSLARPLHDGHIGDLPSQVFHSGDSHPHTLDVGDIVFHDGDVAFNAQLFCDDINDVQTFPDRTLIDEVLHDIDMGSSNAQTHDCDMGKTHAQASCGDDEILHDTDIRSSNARTFHDCDMGNSHAQASCGDDAWTFHDGHMGKTHTNMSHNQDRRFTCQDIPR